MVSIAANLFVLFFSFSLILLLLFVVYSKIEREPRAVNRGLISFVVLGCFFALLTFVLPEMLSYLVVGPLAIALVVILKYGNKKVDFEIPQKQFDERDVMFSRNTLQEGSEKFTEYYERKPSNKILDDDFRAQPGLMNPKAGLYDEISFNAAKASFQTVDLLQALVEQDASQTKGASTTKELSEFIKKWTLKLGAIDVGFTTLKPHHVYTHIGRGRDYGKEVHLPHKFAIAFTVEMSHESMSHNPKGPVLMESSQQYLHAGQIAVQLAQFLRNLGYQSRAHIDANYRLICPIVAQDAGLGTIGRMGLLMTPKLGPRVRIGVVTTELELPVNKKPLDYSAIHFCEICKKCATNCPSQSVPRHSVTKDKQPKRWTINHESCFTFWCKIGTDCGRCMAVCPYSHPNNFMHNIVRWMIKRNPINRWLALKLDDFFYGRKP